MSRFISQSIFIILVYLKCYQTINTIPNSKIQNTYFITNTPWMHNFIGRFDTGIIYKPENLYKPHIASVSTLSKGHVELKDFTKGVDTHTIFKYGYKRKPGDHDGINEILAAKDKQWSENVHILDNNHPQTSTADSSPPKSNVIFNKEEPTRIPYTMYPKRPVLVITRTSVSAKDSFENWKNQGKYVNYRRKYQNNDVSYRKNQGTSDNAWSRIDLPVRYVKNLELPVNNAVKSSLDKERSLSSWREFDMQERDKILKARREPVQEMLHHVPF